MELDPPASALQDEGDGESSLFELSKEPRPFDAALFGETIRKGFTKLYGDTNTTDIVLLVGTSKLPAHRMVLCAWSETFRAMLETSSWSESSLKELPVNVEEDEQEVFKEIVKYMYTGASDFIDGSNVVTVIALANYYGIHSLKEVCGKLLGELVSPSNLFYLLDIVDKYDCRELETMCGQYLASNFSNLWELDDTRLLSLRSETWAAMLKSDELSARSEQVIYEAVLAYANQFMGDEEKRDATLNTLLPLIRWNYLPPAFLMDKVEQEMSIAHLPIVEKLLYDVYRYAACPIVKPSFCARPRTGFQRFNADHKGPNIKLDEDMCVAETTHSGWETVRCLIPLTPSNPYLEFEVISSSNMMLGVAEENCTLHSYAGEQATGHVIHGTDGNFYNGGNSNQKNMTFGAGDKVGMYMQPDGATITFYKNGKKSFDYNGFPKGKAMYPVASFAGSNKVKIGGQPDIPSDLVDSLATAKKGIRLPKPKHS